ncbi:MAG: hypothetical protein GXP42_12660 [Chloroflexi bacterium]|nr:hypothetical protein [Chloroflexota bacterium]
MHPASIEALLQTPQNMDERALAATYAPIIYFDANEPFMPQAVGYTIFRSDGSSPSFPRRIALRPDDRAAAEFAIEYAIWWDWDIGHLYELEHVWVYVDAGGRVNRVEASWHGGWHDMALDAAPALEQGRPRLLSEPGKHAFAPDVEWFHRRKPPARRNESTTRLAGSGGVWVTPLFQETIRPMRTPQANTLVRTHLRKQAFEPAWEFSRMFAIPADILTPWPALEAWIPARVAWWIEKLKAEIRPEEFDFLRIAHRGASAHAPQNTLAAFRKAAELGADMVELDVQVTADGVPVIIHDHVVDRFDGHAGAVSGFTLTQLKAIDAGQGERIPTLDEAIEFCLAQGLGMYLEVKSGRAVQPLVERIAHYDIREWVLVGSFRPDWLAAVKWLDPNIRTSILFSAPSVNAVQLARAVDADFVHPCWEGFHPQPHTLLTNEWVAAVREAGLGIILWHEERPEEIAALRKMGVDGICSDAPERLLRK